MSGHIDFTGPANTNAHGNEPTRATDAGGQRGATRRELAGLSYAEATARLSPRNVQMQADPTVSDTATTTLSGLEDSTKHETTGLCYMENSTKVMLILKAHRDTLKSQESADTDGTRSTELAQLERMIGYLEYSLKITDSTLESRDISLAQAAQAGGPPRATQESSRRRARLAPSPSSSAR